MIVHSLDHRPQLTIVAAAGVCDIEPWDGAARGRLIHRKKRRDMTTPTAFRPRYVPGVPPAGRTLRHRLDRGAATAEYAIATMAAVGFAGLLVVIMRSDEVRAILTGLVRSALTFDG